MKRIGFLNSVITLTLICSAVVSAAVYTSVSGGSWTTSTTWSPAGTPNDTDGVYLAGTSLTNPVYLSAGQTGYADYVYIGPSSGATGGRLDVYGTLDMAAGGTYNGIYFGAWGSTSPPTESHVYIKAGANVDLDKIHNSQTNASASAYRFKVEGGTLDVVTVTLGANLLAFDLTGGTFTLTTTSITGYSGSKLNIDIAGGTLVMNSSLFTSLVSNGTIIKANGAAVNSGNLNTLLDVNSTASPGNSIVTLKYASAPTAASGPSPVNGATGVAPNQVTLSWTAGTGAASHNVYFGTSTSPASIGNQTSATYSPGLLADNTPYYWRIDEVNSYGTTAGTVWTFTTGVAPLSNTPPIANGAVAYWGASSAVGSPGSAHTFTAAAENGTVAGLNLTLNRTETSGDSLWVYDCDAVSTAASTTSRTVALIIPIDLRGWLWWDDPSTSRTITTNGQYYNISDYGKLYTSEYPLAVVSNGTEAICLAIPLDPARPVRFMYDAQNLQLRAEFDFGFYYSASTPGQFFNNRADATVYAYQVSGTTQGFRNGLDTFYDIHSQELVRREGTSGVFVTKTCPASIDNIEDFHIAYNDYGIHGIRHYDWDSVHQTWLDRLSWNEQHGIKGFVYQLPATSYRSMEESYSGTYTATFDGSPANTGGLTLGASPSGSVTYTSNKAVIASNGKLTIADCTNRPAPERLVVQFTILNMADFAAVTESMLGIYAGSQLFGLKRSTGAYGTGNIWKAGSWSSDYGDGQAIPSCSTVTIKIVVSSNFDNCTYVWASYDGGDFEYAGRYLYRGGEWTWSAFAYPAISIYNKSGTPLQIDNLIVKRYSGSIPSGTYSNYFAQYAEDRDMGNPEQQAGAVSYAKDKNGNFIRGGSFGGLEAFFANLDVVRPQSTWPYMSFYEYIRGFFLAESLGWDGWPAAKSSGYFQDLVLNGIFWKDYDQTHFAVATNPLTFDRDNSNAACIGGLWSNHAFVRAVANEHHAHGQVTNLNECFGTDSYRNYLMMAHADISGREVQIDKTDGSFAPPSREDLLHSRSCAARRPNWLLGYAYGRFTSQSVCLKYMQFCMFYGVFPSFVMDINGGAAYEDWYWANPTLYNRDRVYWNLAIPVIQKIDNAGWEPVTRAAVNGGCYIERWGNASTGDLYFTVYNPSASSGATVQVSLEGDPLGLTDRQIEAIEQLYTADPVTVLNGGSESPSLQFSIGAQNCRVIGIKTYLKADFNKDSAVDTVDLLSFVAHWLQNDFPAGDFYEDGVIDLRDFEVFSEMWQQ